MTRTLATLLLIFSILRSSAQSEHSNNYWYSGVGLSFGSINAQNNATGGISILLRRDILKSKNSSLSLGTNMKIGTADKYGVVFPFILLIALSGNNYNGPDPTQGNGDWVAFFSHIPLLINYNFGLGSNHRTRRRFGFYLGGGIDFTATGVTSYLGGLQLTSFPGLITNAGIRFNRNKDIGFSATWPFRNPIGPIYNPVLYQATYSIFF